ncbi:MAG: carboxypeptidase regulatory-like domain-containing protein [Acidimicrobiia bacterium]|nr:carboxypeptidase regulatory-like domain-containing protein [Acidimicrobiia bacterium]
MDAKVMREVLLPRTAGVALIAVVLVAMSFILVVPSASAAGAEPYSVYEFHFLNGKVLSGSTFGAASKFEAPVFNTGFTIHVSCSAVFDDGWSSTGAFPTAGVHDAGWEIVNYQIERWKFQDGEHNFDFDCGEIFSTTTSSMSSTSSTSATSSTSSTSSTSTSSTTPSTDSTAPSSSTQPELFGTIGDYVWLEAVVDGIQGSDEEPVEGVTVRLYQAGVNMPIASTETDSEGKYLFDELPAGKYYVEFVISSLPIDHSITYRGATVDELDSDGHEVTGWTDEIVLGAGQVDLDQDLGIFFIKVSPTSITAPVSSSIVGSSLATSPETLPRTGLDDSGMAGLAVALVAAGSMALLSVRRRHDAGIVAQGWSNRLWDVG